MPLFRRKRGAPLRAEQFRVGAPLPRGAQRRWIVDDEGAPQEAFPYVETMHAGQTVILEDGDWVLPEPDGVHFYPVKPGVFANTYEHVPDGVTPPPPAHPDALLYAAIQWHAAGRVSSRHAPSVELTQALINLLLEARDLFTEPNSGATIRFLERTAPLERFRDA